MQTPDRFSSSIQQPLHLVTQPRIQDSSSDQINKLSYYDIGVRKIQPCIIETNFNSFIYFRSFRVERH